MSKPSRFALLGAALCALAATATWTLVTNVEAAATLDAKVLIGFKGLSSTLGGVPTLLTSLVEPLPFLLFSAALILAALIQKQLRLAVVVAFIIGAANVTTQILKIVLTGSRADQFTFGIPSWPSGHTTAVVSLALCLVLVTPPRRRSLAATLGGLVALGTEFSLMIRGHHLPSDILGGVLVSGGWAFLGVAALAALDNAFAPCTGRKAVLRWYQTLLPPLVASGLILAAVALLALARYDDLSRLAVEHTSFFISSICFVLLGLFLSTTVASLSLTSVSPAAVGLARNHR